MDIPKVGVAEKHLHAIGVDHGEMAYCRVGSLSGQAAIRSSVEKRGRNPRVQMNKQFLLEKFVGRKRKKSAAVANDEKKIHIKQERSSRIYNTKKMLSWNYKKIKCCSVN